MSDFGQDLGALQGKMELFIKQQEEYRKEQKEKFDALLETVETIKTNLETYQTVAKVFKFIGLFILALLTLKLGDAVQLWHHIGEMINGN